MQVMNSTIGSSICSNAIPEISKEFNITNETLLVLPISIFLIGYVLGPLLWGPSSEYFGRKPPLLIAYVLFMIFTLACAVADSFASLLVFRLLNGMVASAPIATVGGLFADVHDDPTLRGRLMAYYMAVSRSSGSLWWLYFSNKTNYFSVRPSDLSSDPGSPAL